MQIQTIPIEEAFANSGECPFCYIERMTENHMMNFVLGPGASYMEPDIRDMTDREGFCRQHFKKMFDYGNALGNAWILKTMYIRNINEMKKEFKDFKPGGGGGLFKKGSTNTISDWLVKKERTCFICDGVANSFSNYMNTFFNMYKTEPGFKEKVKNTKGFCMSHFRVLINGADSKLSDKELKDFYDMVLPLQLENMERMLEDISWFVDKYDYRNRDADWKNSKDAIQRGMQKMKGSDPSIPNTVGKK